MDASLSYYYDEFMSFSYEFMMPQKGSISSFRILYKEGQEYEFFFYILRYKKAKIFMTYLEYLELFFFF